MPPDPALVGRWLVRRLLTDEGEQVTLLPDGTLRVDSVGSWRRPPSSGPFEFMPTGRWGARDGTLVLRWPGWIHGGDQVGILRTDLRRADPPTRDAWFIERME